MDFSKKRRADENGATAIGITSPVSSSTNLSIDDARKIIEPLNHDQLLQILQTAIVRHSDVLEEVRLIADRDPAQRKLFVRGLGWETTTDSLRAQFSSYGELEEAIVILDKNTGKSKGYGFVTFKHIDGALLALKEPSKKIDGRMTVTQLAAAGVSGAPSSKTAADVSMRKIYVGNIPFEISSDRLLGHFSAYGEIEEGPLGFDKTAGKAMGFAFFVYKNEEGAKASLVDPIKTIDGHEIVCKLAVDGKKGKTTQANVETSNNSIGGPPPGSVPSQYGVPGGLPSYGGYSGGIQGQPPLAQHHQQLHTGLPPSVNGPGLSSIGGQGAASMSGGGSFGGGAGIPYGSSQYGGFSNAGSSFYRMPSSSMGMPSGVYPDGGPYGHSTSPYPIQQHRPAGVSPAPRVPPGGTYQAAPPPYY